MTFFDFLALFFAPVVVLVAGCVLAIIALLFALARATDDGNEKTQRIWKWAFPIVRVPKPWKGLVSILGWVFVAGSIVSSVVIVVQMTQPKENAPVGGVSLVSMKFTPGGWNPHMVDFRTASTSGIPAGATFPLKFSELSVFAPPELAGFQVWAEFRANGNEKIGETPASVLQSGLTTLDDVRVADAYQYQDANTGKRSADSWEVLKSWQAIDVIVNYKGPSGQSGSTTRRIKLDATGGTAWWNSPPDVNLVALVYSVDDGVHRVLDMRTGSNPKIKVTPGDWITIHDIWYKAIGSQANDTLEIGASLNDGVQLLQSQVSAKSIISDGFHQIEGFQPMTWVVPSGAKWLGLLASRGDGTSLDQFNIEFSDTEDSGLVSNSKSVVWPFDQFTYLDFEDRQPELWQARDADQLAVSSKQAFSGAFSLAVTTKTDKSQSFIARDSHFRANLVIGQVYWPKQDGITVAWAQACVLGGDYCASISQDTDRWNTFVMDFGHLQRKDGKSLAEIDMSSLYLQGQITGAGPQNPYTFYIDGIQIYPSGTP
jgi:hypothetical protein